MILFERNPRNPNSNKKAVQDTERFVRAMRYADDYSKPEFMAALGIEESKKGDQKYKDLKRHAEKVVFKAVETAPENQTVSVQLIRLRILLPHLIQRGYFTKAERIIQKQLEAAQEQEAFEAEKWLLDTWCYLIGKRMEPDKGLDQLDAVIKRRNAVQVVIEEIEEMTRVRNRLLLVTKQEAGQRVKSIQQLAKLEILQKVRLRSSKAKVIRCGVLRQMAVYLGDTDTFLKAQAEIMRLYKAKPHHFEDGEMRSSYLKSLFAKAELHHMRHEQEHSQTALKAIRDFAEESKGEDQIEAEELYYISSLTACQFRLRKDETEKVLEDVKQWYGQHSRRKNTSRFPLSAIKAAELGFLLGEYSDAMKWLLPLKTPAPNPYVPEASLAAYLIAPLIRVEQRDWEGLEFELKGARRFFKKHRNAHPLFAILTEALGKMAKKGRMERDLLVSAHREIESILAASPKHGHLLHFFDFQVWLHCQVKGKSFIDQMREKRGRNLDLKGYSPR